MQKRGYDPVKDLCKEVSKQSKIPFLDCLLRTVHTPPLYNLDAFTRKRVLEGAFSISEKGILLRNSTILLVDDIYTTGHTVNTCAKILKDQGVSYIYVLTLCVGEN
jgi:predicted amidophosphoribosyltransferase